MLNEGKLESIKQNLELAKKQQKLDPYDTIQTLAYIAHVEHLLLELDNAMLLNQLQANNIRAYIRRLETETSSKEATLAAS